MFKNNNNNDLKLNIHCINVQYYNKNTVKKQIDVLNIIIIINTTKKQ